ncbi:uncharacterized protein LOC127280291 [Leptopilina boulardi]|uniref:uncharacterized protein LOC127280291 n=1 Tax=Leptopilina boulardi TaxID=63433 RepID=UPI0021F58C22|nr:uncharacterized protein LOC127280291 [Leptopilina boulardi]
MDSEIAEQIGAEGKNSVLRLQAVKGTEVIENKSQLIEFDIGNPTDKQRKMYKIKNAQTVENLRLPSQSLQTKDINSYEHLKYLNLNFHNTVKPKILIGKDNSHLITPIETRITCIYEPVGSLTPLGWTIHGNIKRSRPIRSEEYIAQITQNKIIDNDDTDTENDLHRMVKINFSFESMGIKLIRRKDKDAERVENILENTTRRIENKWEAGLLWKYDHYKMPSTKEYAKKRLEAIERKMDRDIDYGNQYVREMEKLIESNYAKKVDDTFKTNDRTWYLAHFGVTNQNKPGKLRLVFDASAKVDGVSLNDQLMAGPDLVTPLLSVLMRFRMERIAFKGDIKEMFLQVKIREEDQNAQRFLWRGWNREEEPFTYVMTSMVFGAASSPHTAQYIKNKNAKEFEDEYPEAVKAILDNHYVDDYLDSTEDEEKAVTKIKQVIKVHKNGGFEIEKWASNSKKVLSQLGTTSLATGSINLETPDVNIHRTLGLIWDPKTDTITFDLSFKRTPKGILNGSEIPTKRQMLQLVMSVFDPLGMLSPYHIKAKILLQSVWKSGIDWDEKLKNPEFKKWKQWILDIEEVKKAKVPRCYKTRHKKPKRFELHTFTDASEQAYSAVVYLRIIYPNGSVEVSYVAGKSRVSPLKPTSIPRMELQGALIGSRLADYVTREQGIKIDQRFFWTDSRNVLAWINADPHKYQAFVAHRLGEISELTNPKEWRWVGTKENPADAATRDRGVIKDQLSTWLQGPEFLKKTDDEWPSPMMKKIITETNIEKKITCLTITKIRKELDLPDVTRFSKWLRLIRSTAWIIVATEIWLHKEKTKPTADDLRQAENLWIKKELSSLCIRAKMVVFVWRTYVQTIPCIWALMEKKSAAAYRSIFLSIKRLIPEFIIEEALIGFENGLKRALLQVFPNIILHGCFFHYKQIQEYQVNLPKRDKHSFALPNFIAALLDVNINKYNPLRVGSFIDLPPSIKAKRACVNVRNEEDNECFMWTILSALYEASSNPSRLQNYENIQHYLNFTNIKFPVTLNDVARFEVLNNISVNVYCLVKRMGKFTVSPIHLTSQKRSKHVNLLRVDDHYIDEDDDKEDSSISNKYHNK